MFRNLSNLLPCVNKYWIDVTTLGYFKYTILLNLLIYLNNFWLYIVPKTLYLYITIYSNDHYNHHRLRLILYNLRRYLNNLWITPDGLGQMTDLEKWWARKLIAARRLIATRRLIAARRLTAALLRADSSLIHSVYPFFWTFLHSTTKGFNLFPNTLGLALFLNFFTFTYLHQGFLFVHSSSQFMDFPELFYYGQGEE